MNAIVAKAKESDFELPQGFFRVHNLCLVNVEPWYFMDGAEWQKVHGGISSRYPGRIVLPFARRKDCDDVACFVVEEPAHMKGEVVVIHDYASPGYEVEKRYESFWHWYKDAIDDMIHWGEPLS